MRKAWGKVYIMDNIDKERLQSEIKHYKEFEASKASIEKKSLGCYRINLTKIYVVMVIKVKVEMLLFLKIYRLTHFLILCILEWKIKKELMSSKEYLIEKI